MLQKRVWTAALLGLGALTAAYAFLIEPSWVDWHQEEVAIPDLPECLEGLRVLQLSDLHFGVRFSQGYLERVVEEANARKPDVIVVTGDLVHGFRKEVPPCAHLLDRLEAKYGVFVILGGHDYRRNPGRLIRSLRAVRVHLLRNDALPISCGEQKLWIVGIDDNSGCDLDDLDEAMAKVPPGAPVLLLMHSPDSILEVADYNVPLALAGHTHGGQVCLPFYGPIRTMSKFGRRFARGRHQVRNTVLYVSRGIGSHHHVRFLARPEVVEFTLRATINH